MIVQHELVPLAPLSGGRLLDPWDAGLPHWREVLQVWRFRRHHRAELRRLLVTGTYLLEDMGLDLRASIEESQKPFWRP